MAISEYCIEYCSEYWWLLMIIILIGVYSINGYQCILVITTNYYTNAYWCLFY
jgi:hypothetical protein